MKTAAQYLAYFSLALLLGLGAFLVGQRFSSGYTFKGSRIDPPLEAQDFGLTDQNGKVFQLSERRGRVVLLFFGYTNCPDVCPTTLAEFKQVRELLGKRAEQVDFVFISLDPARDTQARLKDYIDLFDPAIYGLTAASEAELEPVWKAYGVVRQISQAASAAGYLIDHSARTYAIDRQGRLRETFFFGTEPASVAQDVIYLLGE